MEEEINCIAKEHFGALFVMIKFIQGEVLSFKIKVPYYKKVMCENANFFK